MIAKSPEFITVILAGTKGARLFPLTSSKTPKHLMPVGGVAILSRLLDTIQSSGFRSSIIAVANDDSDTVPFLKDCGFVVKDSTATTDKSTDVTDPFLDQQHGLQHGSSQPNVTLEKEKGSNKDSQCFEVTVVAMSEDCTGSAEALRQLDSSIPSKSHVVVIPGDLVVLEEKILTKLVDTHRQGNIGVLTEPHSAVTMLLADVGEQDEHGIPLKESAKQKKGGLAREIEDIEYIGLSFGCDDATGTSKQAPRVVWKQSKVDVEDDDGTGSTPKLSFPKIRLHASSITRVRTDWSDLHTYAISPWVRKLLIARPAVDSLQGDIVPLLVSRQFKGVLSTFGETALQENKDMVGNLLGQPPFTTADSTLVASPEMDSSTTDKVVDGGKIHEYAVSAVVLESQSGSNSTNTVMALRASSVPAYLYSCRELVTSAVEDDNHIKNPCLNLPEKTQLQTKFHSVLLQDASTGEKVRCQFSTVGRRTKLGSKCRLNNVVVMDDVTVGDNCILQNSILGAGCSVGDNCNLNDCQVAPGATIPSGTKEKGESFFEDETAHDE